MVDVFNLVSKGVIFQEIHVVGVDIIQLIPFVHAFYAFKSLLFYSHHNHESDVTIIPFAMGIPQGDPVGGGEGGALFILAHFWVLHSTSIHFPSHLFPSIAYDIHIPLQLYHLFMNISKSNFM